MRPIDADWLKEDFQNDLYNAIFENLRRNHREMIRISEVFERINDAPTIGIEPDNPDNPKMTNRERFMREISNEDLAKILKDASGGNCPCQYCIETQDTCKLKPCIEGVIEWLESPSDKGETESK